MPDKRLEKIRKRHEQRVFDVHASIKQLANMRGPCNNCLDDIARHYLAHDVHGDTLCSECGQILGTGWS